MREEHAYLFDMLDAAELVLGYIEGLTFEDFSDQTMVQDAVLYRLGVIGEAAGNISEPTRQKLPELPWRKMVGMRNMLMHEYFNVDLNVAWDTASRRMNELIAALEKLLPQRD